MLRARPQLDGTLAVVAIFHEFAADALACNVSAYPLVPSNIAVMFVAHFSPYQPVK
jgi:hypothetical protein